MFLCLWMLSIFFTASFLIGTLVALMILHYENYVDYYLNLSEMRTVLFCNILLIFSKISFLRKKIL